MRSLSVGQQRLELTNTAHTVRSYLIANFYKFRDHFSDGLVGDLCWIAANYTVQRIVYVFKIMKLIL